MGDVRLELEVLGLFIEQAPATLDALRRAGTDRDWVLAAHSLKGSARAVGAWRLAGLAEAAERLGGLADRCACDRVLRHLEDAAAEARAHIMAQSHPA
jgi:HPt (histidine-containing phosphotransfer) domain-containing protein